MNYNTITEAMEQVELPLEIEAKSVYRAFEHIQDGRAKRRCARAWHWWSR